MGQGGELNVGQLVREQYNQEAVLVGFTTYHGTVTAASGWDSSAERKQVRPALPNSYEALLHQTGLPSFLLPLRNNKTSNYLRGPRLERAIGVIYLPETERDSHYFLQACPSSLMSFSTLTKRVQWNLWREAHYGKKAKCLKLFHLPCSAIYKN